MGIEHVTVFMVAMILATIVWLIQNKPGVMSTILVWLFFLAIVAYFGIVPVAAFFALMFFIKKLGE